jgi:hydroxyquinol 1,2-dioxygenase
MRDFNEHNLTEAVIRRFDRCGDPRLKAVMTSLVTHLHAFVREVEPTEAEWFEAVKFLTETGQMCDDRRQEFILLSDTLGVSMLVDAINHRHPEGATETTVLGPFFVENAPEFPLGADIAGGVQGEPLYIEGSVCSTDGAPLPGAIVDVWQSDDDGHYDVQLNDAGHFHLRGRLRTDAEGRFHLWSIKPQFYPIPTDGPVGRLLAATERHPFRPAHVHFMIQAPGHERLVTHVFVDGDPYLDSDVVFGVKGSLVRAFEPREPGVAPDGRRLDRPWHRLTYHFGLKPLARAASKAA